MKYLFALCILCNVLTASAADTTAVVKRKQGWLDLHDKYHVNRIYLYWGYNRDYYLRSDIHIHGPGYNFTMYNTIARDKQTPFSFKVYFSPNTLSIPQYNYRVGFFIKHNIHISIGMDHMKYVVLQYQPVKISGVIDSSRSAIYAGNYNNKYTVLTKDFLSLQHTNGLNTASIEVGWLMPVYHTKKDIIHLGWNFSAGGGLTITRTEFWFTNVFYYNPFHLSGLNINIASGPRIELWKCFFFSAEVKAGEVFLPWAPAQNTSDSGIHQRISFLEYYIVGGLSFPCNKDAWPFIKRKKKTV